ncbi:sensor histidine kinase [Sphingorhabdus arenilitoris]|uniref:histidine kinase n=1 Tax=Sphingorhabdus arenilitoris TaxID=1490041 RepID=A0ABV8RHN4_9SPHN
MTGVRYQDRKDAAAVTADVASDGRLLRADEPILHLHRQAGGTDGGQFAVPGLAAIASATHRIKMRLARAVRVASDDEDIDLWVESKLVGDIAVLTVSGWRVSEALNVGKAAERDQQIDGSDEIGALIFDRHLRLLSAEGNLTGFLGPTAIGQPAQKLFDMQQEGAKTLLTFMEKQELAKVDDVGFAGDDRRYSILADVSRAAGGLFSGYHLDLRPAAAHSVIAGDGDVEQARDGSELLFGQNLAPVLRQPLGRIIANAETIGAKLQGPIRENYASYAKDIANAARHLVALVDDLGDLEAIERPDFSFEKDDIELGDLARRVAGLLALKAADHRITIITPPEKLKIKAQAEFRRVLQILINLVTNAIRYSPAGTRVTIDIQSGGKIAMVTVCDEGTGIAPDDREKIFAKFERLGRSGDGGSGLGLYISRRLARAMGGDLAVGDAPSSTGPGGQGGAKFTLTLPSG